MPTSGKIYFHATSAAESVSLTDECGIFVASEWESLFSRNERSRKSRISEANAEIAQLVEHNLAPKEIRFLTLASGCKTERRFTQNAEIAQLVEHNLAKVRVASSSLVFRSRKTTKWLSFFIFTQLAQQKVPSLGAHLQKLGG